MSITSAVVSYRRLSRLFDEKETTIPGLVIEFVWHLCVIGSRVLVIALFTTRFPIWLLAVVGIHCVVTAIPMIIRKEQEFREDMSSLFLFVALIVVNTLCVFDIGQPPPRLRYMTFHCIMFTENIIMAVLWFSATPTQELWYSIPCLVVILLGYVVGVIFQVIFYAKCHPNSEDIECCVPCEELEFGEYDLEDWF